ncbi:MAG: hypothetical protein KDD64_03080 [Bdellovibrionales bacterium]|nr:hypothetical protein [Bdellovibrionales bacterium]
MSHLQPESRPTIPGESQSGSLDRPFLLRELGVTPDSHKRFHDLCVPEIHRVSTVAEVILHRPMREAAERIIRTSEDILRNCEQDPDDIREEINFHLLIRRVADNLEEYASLVSKHRNPAEVAERIREYEQTIETAADWFERLLERMKANDGKHALHRLKILSVLLNTDPAPVAPQSELPGEDS